MKLFKKILAVALALMFALGAVGAQTTLNVGDTVGITCRNLSNVELQGTTANMTCYDSDRTVDLNTSLIYSGTPGKFTHNFSGLDIDSYSCEIFCTGTDSFNYSLGLYLRDPPVVTADTANATEIYTEFISGSNEDQFKADVSSVATSTDVTNIKTAISGNHSNTQTLLEQSIVGNSTSSATILASISGNHSTTRSLLEQSIFGNSSNILTVGNANWTTGAGSGSAITTANITQIANQTTELVWNTLLTPWIGTRFTSSWYIDRIFRHP